MNAMEAANLIAERYRAALNEAIDALLVGDYERAHRAYQGYTSLCVKLGACPRKSDVALVHRRIKDHAETCAGLKTLR